MTSHVLAGLIALALIPLSRAEARKPANEEEAPRAKTADIEALSQRVRRLQFSLDAVADSTRRRRYVLGTAFLAAPAYLTGIYIAENKLNAGEPQKIAKGVIATTGALFAAGGLLTMFIPGDAEAAGREFATREIKTVRQLEDKMFFGESELRRLAQKGQASRTAIGGLFGAVALADLLWYFGAGSNPQLDFLPYLAGLYGGFAAYLLFFKTPAELEYEAWKDREARPASASLAAPPTLALLPQPGGMGMGLRWTF